MTTSANESPTQARADAIARALQGIGEPITEAQARSLAAREDCDCKEGMFVLAATRRQMFGGAGLVAAVGMTTRGKLSFRSSDSRLTSDHIPIEVASEKKLKSTIPISSDTG